MHVSISDTGHIQDPYLQFVYAAKDPKRLGNGPILPASTVVCSLQNPCGMLTGES